MENTLIAINEACRSVDIPERVLMSSYDIARLFRVNTQAVNTNIAAIMKARIVLPEMIGFVGMKYGVETPQYFGLDMVTALAFRFKSLQADIFREWVLRRIIRAEKSNIPFIVTLPEDSLPN